jgi:hypothetical protein
MGSDSRMISAETLARRNAEALVRLYERAHPEWTRAQVIAHLLEHEPFCQVAPHERPKEQRFKRRK